MMAGIFALATPFAMTAPMVTYAATNNSQENINGLVAPIVVKSAADARSVKAYQIVDGQYSDNKFVQYVQVSKQASLSIADVEAPTSAEVVRIVQAIRSGAADLNDPIDLTFDETAKTWKANVEPGAYIILATGDGDQVYNPALVAVNIQDANDLSGSIVAGEVDMAKRFNAGDTAYLKKSTSTVDKNIVGDKSLDADNKYTVNKILNTVKSPKETKTKGDITAYKDQVSFKLDQMTLPSYSNDYADPEYIITDTLDDDAFKNVSNLVVTVGGENVTQTSGVTITNFETAKTGVGFRIKFDSTFLKKYANQNNSLTEALADLNAAKEAVDDYTAALRTARAAYTADPSDANKTAYNKAKTDLATAQAALETEEGNYETAAQADDSAKRAIVVTYDAIIRDDAPVNFSEHHNRIVVDYSNDPTDAESHKTLHKDTYHYTFGIDGMLDAENKNTTLKKTRTWELNKVEEAKLTYTDTTINNEVTKVSPSALQGAEFTLYTDAACTKAITTTTEKSVSDVNGHFGWNGLDEGTYFVKETKAPDGFTINPVVYRVDIAADLDDASGVLKGYSVTIHNVTSLSDSERVGTLDDTTLVSEAKYTGVGQVQEDGSVDYEDIVINTSDTPAEVVDTKLQNLPSTGGQGVYMFAGVAAILAIVGIGVNVSYRNKQKA